MENKYIRVICNNIELSFKYNATYPIKWGSEQNGKTYFQGQLKINPGPAEPGYVPPLQTG